MVIELRQEGFNRVFLECDSIDEVTCVLKNIMPHLRQETEITVGFTCGEKE